MASLCFSPVQLLLLLGPYCLQQKVTPHESGPGQGFFPLLLRAQALDFCKVLRHIKVKAAKGVGTSLKCTRIFFKAYFPLTLWTTDSKTDSHINEGN